MIDCRLSRASVGRNQDIQSPGSRHTLIRAGLMLKTNLCLIFRSLTASRTTGRESNHAGLTDNLASPQCPLTQERGSKLPKLHVELRLVRTYKVCSNFPSHKRRPEYRGEDRNYAIIVLPAQTLPGSALATNGLYHMIKNYFCCQL